MSGAARAQPGLAPADPARQRRSWLIVRASKRADIEEAARSGADVVVLDLVELVADKDKPAARRAVREALALFAPGETEVFLQTEASCADSDLAQCISPGVSGVVVSRLESAAQVQAIAAMVDRLEAERGISAGTLQIVAAIETAKGNHAALDILAASDRVRAVTLGRVDLVMDLRPEPSGDIHMLPYLMQRLIIVAGTVGVSPLGAWWRAPDRGLLATPQNTYEAARRGRAIGFKGAMCLRPDQVEALNRAFS